MQLFWFYTVNSELASKKWKEIGEDESKISINDEKCWIKNFRFEHGSGGRLIVLSEYSGIRWNSMTMKCIENVFLVYSRFFGKLCWSTKLLHSNAFGTHAYGAFIAYRSIYECIYEAFRRNQLCIPASRNTWSHAPVYKLCSIFHICSNFIIHFGFFSRSKCFISLLFMRTTMWAISNVKWFFVRVISSLSHSHITLKTVSRIRFLKNQ